MTRALLSAGVASVVVLAAALMLDAGCRTPSRPASRTETIWRPLGTWSGRGNVQTESFPGESGAMRITWRTSNGSADAPFTLTMHSAISGRPLQVMVEQLGAGAGTAYLSEDPRVFFAVVDSAEIDWTFTVEEPIDVILTPR
ncbi:MAG: hypothetical protein AB7Q29_18605 [Vicinamibacterales bacterium]